MLGAAWVLSRAGSWEVSLAKSWVAAGGACRKKRKDAVSDEFEEGNTMRTKFVKACPSQDTEPDKPSLKGTSATEGKLPYVKGGISKNG